MRERIGTAATILTLVLTTAYALGFFLWNFYLLQFGFFEYNVLQTRFLSAGVLFLVTSLWRSQALILVPLLLWISWVLVPEEWRMEFVVWPKKWHLSLRPTDKTQTFIAKFALLTGLVLLLALTGQFLAQRLTTFARNDFERIPQYFGGARPFPISLIVAPEKVEFFEDFEIEFHLTGEGKPRKLSRPVCNLYQNSDSIVLGITKPIEIRMTDIKISSRVIILKREEVMSFAPVPAQNVAVDFEEKCRPFLELGWYY